MYALEPHPSTRELLRVNLQLNEAANVRPLAVAAGADRGIGATSRDSRIGCCKGSSPFWLRARGRRFLEVHAHLNPDVTEHVADFCRRYAIRAYLIGDDAGYDQTFRLGEASPYTAVTPAWIVSTSFDHYELLLLPAESAP